MNIPAIISTDRPEWNKKLNAAFIAVLFISIFVRALIFMKGSFWIDEFGTFYVIEKGWAEIADRCFFRFRQSPFYFYFPWLSSNLLGLNEFALRLPSLLAGAAGLALLIPVLKKWFSPETAVLSVFILGSLEEIQMALISARPYGFALLFFSAALLFFIRWVRGGRLYNGFLYALFLSGLFHCQWIFLWTYLIFALIFIYEKNKNTTLAAFVGISALSALSLLPVVPYIYRMWAERQFFSIGSARITAGNLFFQFENHSHPFITGFFSLLMGTVFMREFGRKGNFSSALGFFSAQTLSFLSFPLMIPLALIFNFKLNDYWKERNEKTLSSGAMGFFIGISLLLVYLIKGTFFAGSPFSWGFLGEKGKAAILALTLVSLISFSVNDENEKLKIPFIFLFIGPLIFFSASVFSDAKIFTDRYFIFYTVGLAILIAKITLSCPVKPIKIGFIFLLTWGILSGVSYRKAFWTERIQNWRATVLEANKYLKPETPVLVLSGYYETQFQGILQDPRWREVFLAPLRFYPLKGRLDLIPFSDDKPENKAMIEEKAKHLIHNTSEFGVFLGGGNQNVYQIVFYSLFSGWVESFQTEKYNAIKFIFLKKIT